MARSIGGSHAAVGRFERGLVASLRLDLVGALCEVVGLELALRGYPAGDPIRDRAQLALLERFRMRLHPGLPWRTEVPLSVPGDLRAWDAVVGGVGSVAWRVFIEAETNVADVQALQRRLGLKIRDDPDGQVVLLVSDTRNNRLALKALRGGLREMFPLETREILAALREGREPRGSGLVVL